MLDYKKIIKNRKVRIKILQMLVFVPDNWMLRFQYLIKTGRFLNLSNPKRFTEKIQWYKLYYRNPLMKKCVNKYTVREYVTQKGLEGILVPLYAHYKMVEDIDWDSLPNSFVIKTQHGGGGLNVITVSDKRAITRDYIVNSLHYSQDRLGDKSSGREWAYSGCETGIVVEKLLVNNDNPAAGVIDYKFLCYEGSVKYVIADYDRFVGHKRNFYDRNWNNLHITSDCPPYEGICERPKNLQEMISIAERLSEDFPFVRVDLYNVDGRVFFGELTFYPWSGYVQFNPDEWDYRFGDHFKLIKNQ